MIQQKQERLVSGTICHAVSGYFRDGGDYLEEKIFLRRIFVAEIIREKKIRFDERIFFLGLF